MAQVIFEQISIAQQPLVSGWHVLCIMMYHDVNYMRDGQNLPLFTKVVFACFDRGSYGLFMCILVLPWPLAAGSEGLPVRDTDTDTAVRDTDLDRRNRRAVRVPFVLLSGADS